MYGDRLVCSRSLHREGISCVSRMKSVKQGADGRKDEVDKLSWVAIGHNVMVRADFSPRDCW